MQCANCQFHNMPGSDVCGRCGTSLLLARASGIDIHPPRAGAATLALRRVIPYRRWWHFLREEGIRSPIVAFVKALRPEPFELPATVTIDGVLLRAIVAGWPQWYLQQRWQAVGLFGLYVFFLITGIRQAAYGSAGVALGFAFAIHAWSCIDVVHQSRTGEAFSTRLMRGLTVTAILAVIVYGLPLWAIGRFASPSLITYPTGTALRQGDVVLVHFGGTPTPGSIVIYAGEAAERVFGHGMRGVGFHGQLIDRVLASAGDHVVCRKGVLTINGQSPRWLWLNQDVRLPDIDHVVPADSVFIFPSTVPQQYRPLLSDPTAISPLMFVDTDRVTGIAWWRITPWDRRGRL